MTINVPNTNFVPDHGLFLPKTPPDIRMPKAEEMLINELIGGSGLNMLYGHGSTDTPPEMWDQDKYAKLLEKGDGNAAVAYIVKGLKNGTLSPDTAKALASEVQQNANAAGGGRINREMREALKDALGTDTDHIAKGKTRGQVFIEKAFKFALSILTFGLL
ncbi:hypothetical protein [Noviherbaspirillum aerium]|uniref:hypothetical protein n=1 Tax=Noviherbaspirillum aerium TaxID=2588497 RepID=UPI00124D20F8|nr:hypothetical protein [Noviherbaspirillum aerium]